MHREILAVRPDRRPGGYPSDPGLLSRARAPGRRDRLCPAGDLQPGQDVRYVIPYRLVAQPQPGRDRRAGPALDDQNQHLPDVLPARRMPESERPDLRSAPTQQPIISADIARQLRPAIIT